MRMEHAAAPQLRGRTWDDISLMGSQLLHKRAAHRVLQWAMHRRSIMVGWNQHIFRGLCARSAMLSPLRSAGDQALKLGADGRGLSSEVPRSRLGCSEELALAACSSEPIRTSGCAAASASASLAAKSCPAADGRPLPAQHRQKGQAEAKCPVVACTAGLRVQLLLGKDKYCWLSRCTLQGVQQPIRPCCHPHIPERRFLGGGAPGVASDSSDTLLLPAPPPPSVGSCSGSAPPVRRRRLTATGGSRIACCASSLRVGEALQ